jgi:hypothetical protein
LNARKDELTGPDSETPAVVFADTRQFRVRAFVEELDAPRVTMGMAATVTADGLPGRSFSGRVTRVSPLMGRKRIFTDDPSEHYDVKTRAVLIDIGAVEGLVVGLRVDVTIDAEKHSQSAPQAQVKKEVPGSHGRRTWHR